MPRGLLFIPDISGFTRFINETEIEHSRLIIQELLEILMNANEIDLEVSEVEGDAILFYKYGGNNNLQQLYSQVEKMFCAFHQHLAAYENLRYCQCKACTSAIQLTLKVISHYGEFADYQVKNFHKLIGRDIIVAHQLLKNDIEFHDYWLVTHELMKEAGTVPEDLLIQWNTSSKKTEGGEISYLFTSLRPLKNKLEPISLKPVQLGDKMKMIHLKKDYIADIITLFHAVGDFRYRGRWQDGVKHVEEMNHFLPRVGMRCKYFLDNGELMVYSCSYSYQADKIEFSEADDRGNLTCFTLQKKDEKYTSLDIEYYKRKNLLSHHLFRLFHKKKMKESFQRSMKNLEEVASQIHLPG